MTAAAQALARRRVRWPTAWLAVPVPQPAAPPYARLVAPSDFEALGQLEAMTTPAASGRRSRGARKARPGSAGSSSGAGGAQSLPSAPGDETAPGPCQGGPGAAAAGDEHGVPGVSWLQGFRPQQAAREDPVAAVFASAEGAASDDGVSGVLCAALARGVAVEQACRRHGRFLRATGQGPMYVGMQLYRATIDAELHDLCEDGASASAGTVPGDPGDPSAPDVPPGLGAQLRAAGSAGVVYRSRATASATASATPATARVDPLCVALFGPRGVRRCRPEALLLCAWDGQRFTGVFQRCE